MWYVGMDVHMRQTTFCVLDENGKKIKTRTVHSGWRTVILELKKLKKPFAVCYEASTGYGILFDRLAKIAKRVEVAHPGHLRLIYKSKRKNDVFDADPKEPGAARETREDPLSGRGTSGACPHA